MNIFNKSFVRGYIVGLVSVLVTATSCAEIHYVTQTVDGLEWRLRLDDVAMTASVGTNVTSSAWASAGNYATSSAIDNKSKVEPLQIPSSFTVDGQVYRVTAIGNRAFIRANMTSLIVPEDVGNLYNCALYQCYNLTNLWFKGHATPSREFGRSYVNLNFTANTVLSSTTAIKNVLVGPNLKRPNSNFKIPNGTNVLVLFPYRKDNTTWAGTDVGGTTPNVVYYNDIDDTAGTITFSPTNSATLAEAFATLPTLAPQIKAAFGFDAKVVVNTPIEEATAIPAAFLTSGIPLETTEWVAFEATTQAQLDEVLGACSASSKVLVDPSGATERLEVPAGRHIAMLMSPDGVVKPEERGFMMVVR